MTAALLILATQALDAVGLALALPFGHEANPIMAAVLAAVGVGGIVAIKLVAGACLGAAAARWAPRRAPLLALIGCIGCLSELRVVLG